MLSIIPYQASRLALLRSALVVVTDRPAVFEIEGVGATTCLQGIVSHDLVKPGPDSLGYGAMLTAKGIIVVDLWSLRFDSRILLIVDSSARESTLASLRRQLPPRLAKITDRSDDLGVIWILGAMDRVREVLPLPPAGMIAETTLGGTPTTAATGGPLGWFRAALIVPAVDLDLVSERLRREGGTAGDQADLRAARILAGYPTLGAEITERTLPQEVDFDRLGAVSYAKGCYVGQETVARLHFRGHPNWLLRRIESAGTPATEDIVADGKLVAKIGSVLRLEGGAAIGLASVRREVEPGAHLGTSGILVRGFESAK